MHGGYYARHHDDRYRRRLAYTFPKTKIEPLLRQNYFEHILHELEVQLQSKEKEYMELREVVDSCSRVLPGILMVGRKVDQ
jgi:hypothetical protein